MFVMLTSKTKEEAFKIWNNQRKQQLIYIWYMINKSLSNYSDSTSEEANKRLIKLTKDGMIGLKKTNKKRIHLQAPYNA